MIHGSLLHLAGLVVGVSMMMAGSAAADALKDEIAPTGKLRVAIAISPAGGAFWSTRTEAGGYAGVPVELGREMAAQLDLPVEYAVFQNSGQITDAASSDRWDVTFLPKDPEREARMSFGPVYEVADATYIVKPGSSVTNFETLDQPGIRIAAVNNTTTMRGAIVHLKNAQVTVTRPTTKSSVCSNAARSMPSRCRATSSTPWPAKFPARACWMKPSSRPRPRWRCRSTIRGRWRLSPNS
jgi:polar amino acid transport system substrate-binding protein